MNINEFHPTSGRFVKEDGTTVNIADALSGESVSDKVYDIDNMMPHSGRFIKEDGTCVNIADMIANGDIGGGGGSSSGSSDDSAPPIIEAYNGQTIQCSMSADRPLQGLNLYATCEQKTTTGANLINPNGIEIGGLTNDGGPYITNKRIRTSSIPVTEGERYFLSGHSLHTIANSHVFNSDGERIAGFSNNKAIPSGGVSVRFSFFKNDFELTNDDVNALKSTLMFNKGESALPYEPYTGGKPSPSPEYPQEIQTISDFVVKVKNSMGEGTTPQTLNIAIPEQGFYGLAVDSDGNYTDSNNQRWYADCFNYKTKKFVKCIEKTTAIGEKAYGTAIVSGFGFASRIATVDTSVKYGMCEKLSHSNVWNVQKEVFSFIKTSNNTDTYDIIATLSHGTLGTTDETTIQNATSAFETYLSSNPLTFFYVSKTPIEYNLTDAEIEQYKKLRSYDGTTHIDNDAVPACNMQAELVLDTKLYIDNKFTTLAGQILEMGV